MSIEHTRLEFMTNDGIFGEVGYKGRLARSCDSHDGNYDIIGSVV
jgi:hypothetical protein